MTHSRPKLYLPVQPCRTGADVRGLLAVSGSRFPSPSAGCGLITRPRSGVEELRPVPHEGHEIGLAARHQPELPQRRRARGAALARAAPLVMPPRPRGGRRGRLCGEEGGERVAPACGDGGHLVRVRVRVRVRVSVRVIGLGLGFTSCTFSQPEEKSAALPRRGSTTSE